MVTILILLIIVIGMLGIALIAGASHRSELDDMEQEDYIRGLTNKEGNDKERT